MITELVLIPLAANFISDFSGVMESLKYWLFYRIHSKEVRYRPFRIKPFDCPMCLSFHMTWIWIYFSQGFTNIFIIVLLSSASAAIASIINRIYNRI